MKKIINDPVYGFVNIPAGLPFEIIEHPYFQRLRRIKQLGVADLVYPGGLHTRFQHAIGAMHLMEQALDSFQSKGVMIMDVEREAALAAILLHDIGHGPFSHVLEYAILDKVNHEAITLHAMNEMNRHFQGRLTLAIEMFRGTYSRVFFHQLISSQLDMDRLDYIKRDSFFTGVAEGTIGVERLIKMLNVHDDQLVVEEKGLLSVENFLHARRLMYWQVYLHKTSICAESVLLNILRRVRHLIDSGESLGASVTLLLFLKEKVDSTKFISEKEYFEAFMMLDDIDIMSAIKEWASNTDKVLKNLCNAFLNRHLFKNKFIQDETERSIFKEEKLEELRNNGIAENDLKYYMQWGEVSNAAYIPQNQQIQILQKQGTLLDIAEASDLPTIQALGRIVKKTYLCWFNTLYLS